MAEARSGSAVTMECGFCLQTGSGLVDPRALSCSHTHCMKCLTDSFKRSKIIRCPKCKEVCNEKLDSLPSPAQSAEDGDVFCDTCKRKGINSKPAVIYCRTCTKRFCEKHSESHDDLHEDHSGMTIDEYKSQAKKLKIRTCTDHPNQQHIMGCQVCVALFCAKCLSGTTTCTDGTPHDLLPPDDLLAKLTTEINGLKEELVTKEEKLNELYKTTSKIKSDYENETVELIVNLHKTRDEQIQAINTKYKELEMELVRLRAECVQNMTKFMEEDVGGQMTHLNQHRLRIEASFKQSHKVDIVSGYNDLKAELERLIEEGMPELEVDNIRLDNHGESRQIELDIGSAESGYVHSDHAVTTTKSLFKSVKFITSVKVSSPCVSVCYHQGNTYAGLWDNSVDRIDSTYQHTQAIMSLDSNLKAITLYQDRIYALKRGIPNTVYVYDIAESQFVTSWKHADSIGCSSSIAVVNGMVVIPNRGDQHLIVYSLDGEVVIRRVPCPILGQHHVGICTASKDSVIVSDCGSSQVSRINIISGEAMWTTKLITKPQGVTCYGKRCVLVASSGTNQIQALSLRTGEIMGKIEDDAIKQGGSIFDLQTVGNILIVPTYSNSKVLYYQLGK